MRQPRLCRSLLRKTCIRSVLNWRGRGGRARVLLGQRLRPLPVPRRRRRAAWSGSKAESEAYFKDRLPHLQLPSNLQSRQASGVLIMAASEARNPLLLAKNQPRVLPRRGLCSTSRRVWPESRTRALLMLAGTQHQVRTASGLPPLRIACALRDGLAQALRTVLLPERRPAPFHLEHQ